MVWRGKGRLQENKNCFGARIKCHPIQVVQDVPTTSQVVMEAPESRLVEGGVSDSWKETAGIFTPKRQKCKPVQNDLVTQCRGKNIIRNRCKAADISPERQYLY